MITQTLTLRKLDNVLDGFSLKLIELQKKFDACKNQLQATYKKNLDNLDEKKREFQKKIEDNIPNLSEKLKDDVNYRINIQRRRIEDKLKNLEDDIKNLENHSDEIHVKLAQETERVRKLNPELDKEEETLKEEWKKLIAKNNDLQQEIAELSKNFLKKWANRERIRELRNQLENLRREISSVKEKINKVRERWQGIKEEWGREKVTAEEEWNELTLRIAEIKHEYLYTKNNQEKIVVEEGIRRFIEELIEGKYIKPENYSDEFVRIYIAEISPFLKQKKMLEDVIEVTAKFVGKLVGIDRGIKRLRKSIDALKNEQDRYESLSELHIEPPPSISEFQSLLGTLDTIPSKSFEDLENIKKILGSFLDENKTVPTSKGQLSNENIKKFFDTIDNSITVSVKKYWG